MNHRILEILYGVNHFCVFTEYQCGKLTAPENGVVDVEAYTKGSKAKYICKSGYKLEGTGLRVCQITATKGYRYTALWTGKQPNCKGKIETSV